jgi:gluconolactonase
MGAPRNADVRNETEVVMRSTSVEFEFHDAAFAAVVGDGARLVKVADSDAHEGPVYVPSEDALYFTTVPRPSGIAPHGAPEVSIKRLALRGTRFPLTGQRETVVRSHANGANGMALGHDGRLVVCEQGTTTTTARISALNTGTGDTETIVSGCGTLPFNSPNDVVVNRDGTIWFTDPSYGYFQGFKPAPVVADRVYRYNPSTQTLTSVLDDFDKPNGLAFSPCGSVLYVGDSGANHEPETFQPARPHHIRAVDVAPSGKWTRDRLFAVIDPGFPDGIKVDVGGRVYSSAFDGVQVFTPEGRRLGTIHLPGAVNFTFGGADRNVLFITADTAVWAAVLNVQGA